MNIAGAVYCFHSQIIRRCLAGGEHTPMFYSPPHLARGEPSRITEPLFPLPDHKEVESSQVESSIMVKGVRNSVF